MGEISKLQNHLRLLREEYQSLQTRYQKLEKENQVLKAGTASDTTSFYGRLIKIVQNLFGESKYSDITVRLKNRDIPAHRFVLEARHGNWGSADLDTIEEINMTDLDPAVGYELLRWVYTNDLSGKKQDQFMIDLLSAACRFNLESLKMRCETALLSEISVSNCIAFYMKAEELSALKLKRHCSEMISTHWMEFGAEDFKIMPARLLLDMFEAKTEYPLHAAIRAKRDDVVFIYLTDNFTKLADVVNSIDARDAIPLDMALAEGREDLAGMLVSHSACVDMVDRSGFALIHRAVARRDEGAASFLLQNDCKVNSVAPLSENSRTALHMIAAMDPDTLDQEVVAGMARVAELIMLKGADPNIQDAEGNTPLHLSIMKKNEAVFSVLVSYRNLDLEVQNNTGHSPLWLAFMAEFSTTKSTLEKQADGFSAKLVEKGANPNSVPSLDTGDSLLHLCSRLNMPSAGQFLVDAGAQVNAVNASEETPLHLACDMGQLELTRGLLGAGADPNMARSRVVQVERTRMKKRAIPPERLVNLRPHREPKPKKVNTNPFEEEEDEEEEVDVPAPVLEEEVEENYMEDVVDRRTPLHIVIASGDDDFINIFLDFQKHEFTAPNWLLRDSNEDSAFSLSLWGGKLSVAERLLGLVEGGPSSVVQEKNADGLSLLHQAISMQNMKATLFLLEHGAGINEKTWEGKTPLQLAIENHLAVVVSRLCEMGAELDHWTVEGRCPLWQALDSGQEDIACILVSHHCDVDMWGHGPGGCLQTLLHRAIEEKNEAVANFLIRNACDVNASRRPGTGGSGSEGTDGQTPLHLACRAGLTVVVQALLHCGRADVNKQDAQGLTPLHVAITTQQLECIDLLLGAHKLNLTLKDRAGQTPFHVAMAHCNQEAARAILKREPTADRQVDNRGRNFLHVAVQTADTQAIFFLIQIHADMNGRVQDSQQLTPLHLAVSSGVPEHIVRSLLLAGANINDQTLERRNALHLAVLSNQPELCRCLLDNNIECNSQDNELNTALHLAMKMGNKSVMSILLDDTRVNPAAINMKGETPLHVLARYGKDSGASFFEMLMDHYPEYNINAGDANGDTPLLLAYSKANSRLCVALLKRGASIGCMNASGVTIFNQERTTNQLLHYLLDSLSEEPAWCEAEICLNCCAKFGLTLRKHHCRHCGRVLCDKCSSSSVPIVKYNVRKPVRVCNVCFNFLNNPDNSR